MSDMITLKKQQPEEPIARNLALIFDLHFGRTLRWNWRRMRTCGAGVVQIGAVRGL